MIKKYLYFIIPLLFIANISFGQTQIVNLGFEQWDNAGSSDQEPVGWSSFKTAGGSYSGFVDNQKIERSTDKRPGSTGTYSTRIWATSAFGGVIANGTMTTGQIQAGGTSASSPNNHNKTIRSNASFNQPFSGYPDSLVVWAKVNTSNSSEQARIAATIHDNYDYRDPETSDANAPAHVVGKANYNFNTNGSWQRISIPFDYNYPATSAQYILITITTNKTPGGGAANDEVFVDDLQFIYNPVVTVSPSANQTIVENQTGTTLSVSENFTPTAREWKYSTISGSGYTSFSTPQTGATYTPLFANTGIYYVVCESNNGSTVTRSNQVKITVNQFTNNITPTATQTIFQNQAGIALDVSESPSATSREWKYSTTQGGPYQSFATAETGMSYTPLFFAIDTYYIVCESKIGTATSVSNEVQINVLQSSTPSISITPSGSQTIEVNNDGAMLTANETITPTAREWKYSTTQGGPYQSFSPTENGSNYTPNFNVAGMYYIICESTMSGTVYTSNEVEITVLDIGVTITPDSTQHLIEYIPGDTLFAIESQPADSREWKFNRQLGAPFQSFATPQTDTYLVPTFEDASWYYVICESTFNGITKTSNMVIFIVENGPELKITPFASQTVEQEENGNTLTADAGNFTIESLEWKYNTVDTGSFISFATPETNNTYTPLFADTGVYYIQCEAVIQGTTFISNQVKVTVTEKNSVGIIDMQNTDFKVYASNNNIIVDLSRKDFNNSTFDLYNLQGQKVATQQLVGNSINSIKTNNSLGYYFYSITHKQDFYRGKLFLK